MLGLCDTASLNKLTGDNARQNQHCVCNFQESGLIANQELQICCCQVDLQQTPMKLLVMAIQQIE